MGFEHVVRMLGEHFEETSTSWGLIGGLAMSVYGRNEVGRVIAVRSSRICGHVSSVRCRRALVRPTAPLRPLVCFVCLLLVVQCSVDALAEVPGDDQERDSFWYVQGGAYIHWLDSEDFVGPPILGSVEHHRSGGWSGGLSLFNNSFGQFTQYLYLGKEFRLSGSRPELRLKLSAGVVHGYKDEFYDTLPIRWGGSWGLGFVPAVGYHKGRVGYDVAVLGVAGVLFLVGYSL